MPRVLVVLAVVAVAFWVFSIVDALMADRARVRAFPKQVWVAGVVLLPVIGGLLWLFVGKARRSAGGVRRPIAPDDDPTFLGTLSREDVARRAADDERLRRLEQELADLDDDTPADPER